MKIPQQGEIRKPSKTLAGVTPIAVMCKPKKCKHGTCTYCPSLNVPQSYTPKSPPVLRAEILKYNAEEQVKSRLKAFNLMNHPTEKIEIIIMGGDFLNFPTKYQNNFIKQIYDALNKKQSKTLEQAKKLNQKAKHRCVALCIETRPDSINQKSIQKILNYGCTRVELGVQCLDNKIYKAVNRGHTVEDVIQATHQLKNAGFKIGYHMMLGLPKSNPKKDLQTFETLFKNQDFKPDQLKIYPCQVIKGSQLEKTHKKQKYKPYSKEQIQELIIQIMKIIPNYCRVMRVMREIPPEFLTAGTTRIDLRRDIEQNLKQSKTKINEIRFREIGFHIRDLQKNQKINPKLKLKTTKYQAQNGTEYFLEITNNQNILFALLRLRITNQKDKFQYYPNNGRVGGVIGIDNAETNSKAIIREIHVYGQSLSIGQKPKHLGQHTGLGKQLIHEAEQITKKHNIKNLQIISGVGVREYYKKLKYKLDKNKVYMGKKL
ncbi:tRNA uridine(34) 5-carboxymethylaminomethyl modification radical SAM/GNAT enzyme Elp3 [archaeon]|jgi:elongator complex protein 3|nr:tRNA uridine(34) 5-carboxymethylaminomethyl modification radical SAM/GNAT enzyme Elp3 [archaeon]